MFSVGRTPAQPYQTFAHGQRLEGVRIGVVREFMNKKLFTKTDEETIDIVDRTSVEHLSPPVVAALRYELRLKAPTIEAPAKSAPAAN